MRSTRKDTTMNRKLKAVGLALLAVLVMAVVGVSQASATNVTAGTYPATLTGSDINTAHGKLNFLSFGINSRYIECTTASSDATITDKTTKITIKPTYSNCFSNGITEVPSTVTMNKCDYTLEFTTKTTAQTSIDCEKAGEQIEVHIYENAVKHKNSHEAFTKVAGFKDESMCTYDIKPQGPLKGVTVATVNKGTATEDLVVNFNAMEKLKITSTLGGVGLCGSVVGETTATLGGEFTYTGEDINNAHIPIMME